MKNNNIENMEFGPRIQRLIDNGLINLRFADFIRQMYLMNLCSEKVEEYVDLGESLNAEICLNASRESYDIISEIYDPAVVFNSNIFVGSDDKDFSGHLALVQHADELHEETGRKMFDGYIRRIA